VTHFCLSHSLPLGRHRLLWMCRCTVCSANSKHRARPGSQDDLLPQRRRDCGKASARPVGVAGTGTDATHSIRHSISCRCCGFVLPVSSLTQSCVLVSLSATRPAQSIDVRHVSRA
jgi:hypothetical protein